MPTATASTRGATTSPAQQRAEAPQVLEVPREDFIVINGKVFTLNETTCPVGDLVTELKEFYKMKAKELQDEYSGKLIVDVNNEWEAQTNHIRRVNERNTAVIPPALHDKIVTFRANEVMEVRLLQYRPTVMTGTANKFRHLVNTLSERPDGRTVYTPIPQYKKMADWLAEKVVTPADEGKKILVKLKQNLVDVPRMAMFSVKRHKILFADKTFHVMNDMTLCTGNNSAEQFWTSPAFAQNINIINLYSPATHEINVGERVVHYKELLADAFIQSITLSTGGTGWTV